MIWQFLVGFCDNPEVGIKNPDDIQECKDNMADFMPQVLQVLFTNIEENSQKPCYDTFGVCEPSETSTEYAYDTYDDNFDSITLTKRAVLKGMFIILCSDQT